MNNNIIIGKNKFICLEISDNAFDTDALTTYNNFNNENNVILKELFNMEYEKLIDKGSELYIIINETIFLYNINEKIQDIYCDLEYLKGLEAQEYLDKLNNFTKYDFKNMKMILEDILDIIEQLEAKKE